MDVGDVATVEVAVVGVGVGATDIVLVDVGVEVDDVLGEADELEGWLLDTTGSALVIRSVVASIVGGGTPQVLPLKPFSHMTSTDKVVLSIRPLPHLKAPQIGSRTSWSPSHREAGSCRRAGIGTPRLRPAVRSRSRG